jgi:replicative DNA helicase
VRREEESTGTPPSPAKPDAPQLESLKLPPHSLEAEQSILGALLLDIEAADRIGDVLSEDDFYTDAHRVVYRHIVALGSEGKPVDVVTLSETLGAVQKLDYVGGLAYLGALVQNVPTSANIRHYAAIVRERSILRQLAATAGEIADSAYNPLGRSAKEILDQAEAKVLHIAEQGSRGNQVRADRTCWPEVVDRIETLFNRDDPSDDGQLPTGFTDLDRMTSPAARRFVSSPAGRAWGKTRWRSTSASMWRWLKLPVAVFSMEMGAQLHAPDRARWAGSTSTSCSPGGWPTRTGRSSPARWGVSTRPRS